MQFMPTLFGELPASAAKRWRESKAITFSGQSITFGDVDDQVDVVARALIANGIRKGDCVGLWITNRPEFVIAFYGIVKIGAIAVPLNTRYRQDDIRYVVRHAECKLLISVERSGPVDYLGMLQAAIPGLTKNSFTGTDEFPDLNKIVLLSDRQSCGVLSWENFLAAATHVEPRELAKMAADVKISDIALIVFTSGTTGNPKGVMHDHKNLKGLTERAASWPLAHGDTVLNFLPMFHLLGLSEMVMACMTTGVHQVVTDVFDAEQSLLLIEKERINGVHGFETHFADLLIAHEHLRNDISSLKFGTLPAGMENSTAVARRVQDLMCPTVTGFGMSETWAWACMSSMEDSLEQRCDTSGRPMPGVEIKIVNADTGEEVLNGTVGEILCRGYNIMRGYFRDPEATAKTLDSDGWLHSGDRGVIRADGFLWFLGRYKEMLKVGGENVAPAGVEEELQRLVPSIAQVAVVGYPDARLSEVPVAYVVPKPGSTCTLEQVQELCSGKIASYKIPRHVLTVASLPMTASGKVQRTFLKQQALLDIPKR